MFYVKIKRIFAFTIYVLIRFYRYKFYIILIQLFVVYKIFTVNVNTFLII